LFTVPTGLNFGQTYCIAPYYILDALGKPSEEVYWWYYDLASKKYPTIAVDYDIDTTVDFFPVIPLRYENADMTREDIRTTPLYKTSKQLLKKINLDFNTLAENLNESEDIAEIDHAYILFGIDLQTTNVTSLVYLTEYFHMLWETAVLGRYQYLNQLQTQSPLQYNEKVFSSRGAWDSAGYHTTEIYEYTAGGVEYDATVTIINSTVASNLVEYGLDLSMTFSYITSVIRSGTIGAVGTATLAKTAGLNTKGWDEAERFLLGEYSDLAYITLRHQITAGTYREVTVYGLAHTNFVYGDRGVHTTIDSLIEDEDNHSFIIPLHYGVARMLTIKQQNLLYQEALLLMVNSYEFTELGFFETSFFQFLIGFVMMAISVLTINPGPMLAFAIVAPALSMQLGPEVMMVLAVVMILCGAYSALAGSVGSLMDTLATTIMEMPTSQLLLRAASAVLQVVDMSIGQVVKDIMAEYEAFQIVKEQDQKRLDDAKELLKSTVLLDINLLDTPSPQYINTVSETPTAFYDRTIHIGNIGTLVLNIIPDYHNILLTLPEAKFA